MSTALEVISTKTAIWLFSTLIGVILALIGVIWQMRRSRLDLLTEEISKLRQVRHEDREAITDAHKHIEILAHDYKQLIDRNIVDSRESQKEIDRLRWLLNQVNKENK